MKHKVKTSGEINKNDSSCTCDESKDGQSSISHNNLDSDASLEMDTNEETDTTMIEEEDWVDYIKRSTIEAIEKGKGEDQMLEQDSQKMKWKLTMLLPHHRARHGCLKLLFGTQNSAQNFGPTEQSENQGKDGETTSLDFF